MIRVVLVDDEPQSCKSLAIKLHSVADDIEVAAMCHHPSEAISVIKSCSPHVVFLDIEMPGMNGFQLVEKLEEFEFEIIFITAYNDYMLNALHISAFDYLLKPVDPGDLKNALGRLRKKIEWQHNPQFKKEQLELLGSSLQATTLPKRIALATLNGFTFIRIAEIVKVEALSNYSVFTLLNKQKITASKTLKEFERVLVQQNFFRVNRSCIVNSEYIIKYKNEAGGVIELQDGSEVSVGPHRKSELIQLLAGH